jgi:CDP-diacylglycerol--glycerol-3-phosphate 3-phosphatidyltransferase
MIGVDLACSLFLLSFAAVTGVAYGLRVLARGAARSARVDAIGPSVLLGKSVMEMFYWALTPLARACVRAGISANAITLASLGLGLVAGGARVSGHFGVAALAVATASHGDALDGHDARETGTHSRSGALLDAAVDRYEEFFFLGGLACYFRADLPKLCLVLLAVLGSFMVSYGSAKGEALGVGAPRGVMRRAERAVYLGAGALLTPIAAAIADRAGEPWITEAPVLTALAFVGVVANVSAVRRMRAVACAADAPRLPAGEPARVPLVRSEAR